MKPTLNFVSSALAALTISVLAQDDGYVYQPISGCCDSVIAHDWGRFVAAGRSPNMTRSVTFAGTNNETWTWQVNISNVAVPDAEQPYPSEQPPLVDAHVVQTTYDLQWPGGGPLYKKINQSVRNFPGPSHQVCFTKYDAPVKSKYANQYKEDDNGDCASIFGEKCKAAYLAALTGPSGGSCQSPDSPVVPEACKDRISPQGPGQSLGTFTRSLGNGTAANGTDPYGRPYNNTESGVPVYYSLGGPNWKAPGAVNGSNTTALDAELSYVQMMALTGMPDGLPRLLCMRVSLAKTGAAHSNTAPIALTIGLAVMSFLFVL